MNREVEILPRAEMLEDLHIGLMARESKDEPRRSFSEVVDEMRAAGEIDV